LTSYDRFDKVSQEQWCNAPQQIGGLVLPKFDVEGVKPEDSWQLFNCSNYKYFAQKVQQLRKPFPECCSFCVIDPAVNKILLENRSWLMWQNLMAPTAETEVQLIVVSRRHIESIGDLSQTEWDDLLDMIKRTQVMTGYGYDGIWNVRTGDPETNAKSMPHIHFNFQKARGTKKAEITIGKGPEDYEKKRGTLELWYRYFKAQEENHPNPRELFSEEEWAKIEGKKEPPKPEALLEKPKILYAKV
jgi:diadenosine tetraphosphate (Ap4A) HIT family hydrolase